MSAIAWIASTSAAIALLSLYFTSRQVGLVREQTETQKQVRRDAAQPYVWVDLRPDAQRQHVIVAVLRNEGPTVATDVRVTFDPPLPRQGVGRTPLSTVELSGLPPGRQMQWFVDVSFDWLQGDAAKLFNITVAAVGPYGPTTPLAYVINVSDYRGSDALPPGTLHGVTDELKKLTKAIGERT